MKPPSPDFAQTIARVVASQPGLTIPELRRSTGCFASELDRALYAVEIRDGRAYPRMRRKKVEQPTTFWARLRAVFAP